MRIVILCADPREQADLARKVDEKLLEPGEKIILISLLGGPICLAHPETLKVEADCLLKQIRDAQTIFPDADEVVLIGHECGFYSAVLGMMTSTEAKKRDLAEGANFLVNNICDIAVSAHFDISTEDEVAFEEIVCEFDPVM